MKFSSVSLPLSHSLLLSHLNGQGRWSPTRRLDVFKVFSLLKGSFSLLLLPGACSKGTCWVSVHWQRICVQIHIYQKKKRSERNFTVLWHGMIKNRTERDQIFLWHYYWTLVKLIPILLMKQIKKMEKTFFIPLRVFAIIIIELPLSLLSH